MNIYQTLYDATYRSADAPTDNQQARVLTIVDNLWANRRKQGGLDHFVFVVENDAKLKAELEAVTNKAVLDDKLVELAQTQGGYTFTVKEVRAAIKNARPVDEARAALKQLATGGFEAFLTAVRTSADLQQKVQSSFTSNTKAWARALVKIGKEAGYSFKAEEIEAIATGVLPNSNAERTASNPT
ncbi:MAG: Nif11 family protein [Cyanothece sp. SIO1E1]|nr:Nif11 family protein [Cyanothece sp. SIO1E1]